MFSGLTYTSTHIHPNKMITVQLDFFLSIEKPRTRLGFSSFEAAGLPLVAGIALGWWSWIMVETFQSRWCIIISCIALDILGTQGWVMTHIKTNQVESLEVSFNRGFISFLENKSCILYIYVYIYFFWICVLDYISMGRRIFEICITCFLFIELCEKVTNVFGNKYQFNDIQLPAPPKTDEHQSFLFRCMFETCPDEFG
jgi:hypothetical protein